MHYREHSPSPDLSPFVRCYWTLEGRPQPGSTERILPDGRQELVFHLGDPAHQLTATGPRRQDRALYIGQMDAPVLLQPSGSLSVFGICFPPGGAAAFFPHPQQETAGRILPLADIAPVWSKELTEAIRNAPAHELRIAIAEIFLRRHLRPRPPNPLVHAAAGLIQAQPWLPVSQIAKHAGCSSRHLERAFLLHVGITPKTLARIARFQRVLQLRAAMPSGSWTHAALEAGYYDQAHLIADYHRFTGSSPTWHESETTAMERAFVRLKR